MSEFKYLLIGNGRVARHLAHYFNLLKIPFDHWYRNSHQQLSYLASNATHILLAISDDAISSFYKSHPEIHHKLIVHFSGAHSYDFAFGAHPLMTFTWELYDLETYEKIYFTIEDLGKDFSTLLPGLKNPFIQLKKENKAYYHALCVLGGNFPVLLWKKMLSEFETHFGIPRQAVWPYLEKVFLEFRRNPETSLTGPFSRGDQKTIEKNLKALEGDKFRWVYKAFLEAQ